MIFKKTASNKWLVNHSQQKFSKFVSLYLLRCTVHLELKIVIVSTKVGYSPFTHWKIFDMSFCIFQFLVWFFNMVSGYVKTLCVSHWPSKRFLLQPALSLRCISQYKTDIVFNWNSFSSKICPTAAGHLGLQLCCSSIIYWSLSPLYLLFFQDKLILSQHSIACIVFTALANCFLILIVVIFCLLTMLQKISCSSDFLAIFGFSNGSALYEVKKYIIWLD